MKSKYKVPAPFALALGLWLALWLAPVGARAQSQVTKNFSEKYTLANSDLVDLSNRYGKVHVNTWDKAELTVDILVKAWARSESKANEMLGRVKINYGRRGSAVYFETVIDGNNVNIGNNSGFEVNYTVNMPRKNRLKLYNRYGSAFLGDFAGDLDLSVRYGKFVGGKLTGSSKKIEIAYGGMEIEQLESGTIDISYSSGNIEHGGNISLDNRYTKVSFGSVGNLQSDTKYGGISVEKEAESIKGTLSYSDLKVGQIKKELAMEARYAGTFRVDKIAKGFSRVELVGGYSSFTLGFEPGAAFKFEVNTSYGGFKNDLPSDLSRQIEQNTSKEYTGTVGSDGSSTVKVLTRYGSIRFEQYKK
jgi:hypothetical protein